MEESDWKILTGGLVHIVAVTVGTISSNRGKVFGIQIFLLIF